jgi:hypothetical protein
MRSQDSWAGGTAPDRWVFDGATTRWSVYDGVLFRWLDGGSEPPDRWLGGAWRPAVGELAMSEEEWDHQRLLTPEQARRWMVEKG